MRYPREMRSLHRDRRPCPAGIFAAVYLHSTARASDSRSFRGSRTESASDNDADVPHSEEQNEEVGPGVSAQLQRAGNAAPLLTHRLPDLAGVTGFQGDRPDKQFADHLNYRLSQ